jgi:translocation and assembly module TamB
MRAADLHRRSVLSHAARIARLAAAVTLVALAAAALLVGGGWGFLQTRWGGQAVRHFALPAVNRQIAGRLELARFGFGGDRLTLEGLVLRDPAGSVVARVERLEVGFSRLALLHRHVDLTRLAVVRPELWLVQDADGSSNLARALAPRAPAAAEPKPSAASSPGERGLIVDLRRLGLEGGDIDVRALGDGSTRHVQVSALAIAGSAHFESGPQRAARATIDLTVDAHGLHLDAKGELDLRGLRALGPGLVVHARDLDLAQLYEGAPASNLAFDLEARGGGADPAALDGAFDFAVPAGRLGDKSVGPLHVAAQAVRGDLTLSQLRLVLPGIEITGRGHGSAAALDAQVRVEASDLGALSAALTAWRLGDVTLAGRGRLDLALGGSLAAPSLRLTGDLPRLRSGGSSVQSLALRAEVPNLRTPEAADVDVTSPRAVLGGQTLRGLTLAVRAVGPRPTINARSTGPFPLTLAVRGRRGSARTDLTLDALDLRYPEARWSLARPARLDLGDGQLSITGFALRAGPERIEIDLIRKKDGLRGHLLVEKLDLGRLPRVLVPAALGVGGMVDLDARLAGSTAAPRLDAKLSLAGGRVRGYRDLSLALEAHYASARATGRLDARGLGTAVSTRFDLPGAWPIRERRAPLHLDLTLAETDLAAIGKALAVAAGQASPADLRGRAHLTAHLDGSLEAPRLTLALGVKGLAVQNQPVGDVDLEVRGEGERPVEAHLKIANSGGAGAHTALDLTTPLSLRAALRHPPTPAMLERAPFDLRGDVDRLPLAVLAQLASHRGGVGGTLSTHLAFAGTALEPRGKLTADVVGASAAGVPATDGRLEVELERHAIDAHLRVLRKQHPLLALQAHLEAGIPALRDPARLAQAPLKVRVVVGPLQLQRLGLPAGDRQPPRVLKGQVHLDLAVDGTLHAPRLLWHADADDIRLDKSVVGVAHLEGTYADRRAKVDARLVTVNEGQLKVAAATTADLGYPQVTRGIDVRHLPVDLHFEAQRFDLQGLSGATEGLRTVGGLLSAAATVGGTVSDPHINGRVEWRDGQLAITGLGEYRDIHLAVHGDEQKLVLDELTAKSGNGTARITGEAAHADGSYRFTARADVGRFPIYQEGQPLAQVSIVTTVSGSATPFDTRADVRVQDARIELSDAKRKNLQPLASPKDVVLVDDGKPLNKAQADRLRALIASRPQPTGSALATPKAPAPPAGDALASAVRVTVSAPRRIWVTGQDAYFEIGLEPGFKVSMTDQTRVVGQVVVKRGRINIFGRRFDLKSDSTLEFDGPPERPQLDLTAQYQDQADNVTVVLTAKGPLEHLTVGVSSPSRPDLQESQLYTLIITGHLPADGSSGSTTPTAEAGSLLGGVLAAQLQKTLAKKLPLDVLTIDAGGGEGLTGTQLEAGRYVADKLYVGYVGRVGADPNLYQNRNAVHVEYQLTSRWGVDGEYGDVGTGSLDLTWKKNY